MEFLSESTFWYYLGHCLWSEATDDIIESVLPMNSRASELHVPVEWRNASSIPWAVSCRAYILSQEYAGEAGRKTFNAFRSGISASIGPKGFFGHALERIMGNVLQPALPGRAVYDTVADAFAAASMNYVVSDAEAESIHPRILELIVTDHVLHEAALLVVTPSKDIWLRCVSEYSERRPPLFKRLFSNADKWLFK